MTGSVKVEKVLIIGSGPAGHTAAIYAARANLEPLMLEGFMAGGVVAGGQLTTTTDIENFPGFPRGIGGQKLMEEMREQSLHYGARIETETVTEVDLGRRPFLVRTEDQDRWAETLIIASGATAKRLGIPGEEIYWQRGVSACAVCDGGLPLFRNQALIVVGGGDTAAEEATYLSRFGSEIHLMVRRDELRASRTMQDRILRNPKIVIHWNTEVLEIMGDGKTMTGIRAVKNRTGAEETMAARGLFYAIGHTPNSEFLASQLEVDADGYIRTQPGTTRTSVPGVFAAGDVQDKVWRQAITSAGTGCMAALEAERYLSEDEAHKSVERRVA